VVLSPEQSKTNEMLSERKIREGQRKEKEERVTTYTGRGIPLLEKG